MLPDIYSGLDFYKEKNAPYHLPNDSVIKKATFTKHTNTFSLETIQKCKKRVADNKEFNMLKVFADSLKFIYQLNQVIPLDILGYIKFMKGIETLLERIGKSMENVQEGFNISNHSFAKRLLDMDNEEKEFNDEVIKDLQLDPAIAEAARLLKDFISFDKK
jgi:hypothetical protein